MLPEVRLDTDSFKALIEEYRMQIAGIYPEWTNYNYSDPGMTLVELFAWMKENQQFFMEQLSPQHYHKFLKLMGIVPHFIQPAVVIASVAEDVGYREAIIPKGTVFYADDVPYTMIRDNTIPEARICRIKTRNYVTEDDLDIHGAVNIYPFGKKPEAGDSLEIYLDKPLPSGKECFLTMIIKDVPQRNPMEGDSFRQLTKLAVEYYAADGWKELEQFEDSSNGLLSSGRIGITIAEPMAETEDGKYAIRITLKEGVYDRAPFVTNIGFHFVRLSQQIEAECSSMAEGLLIGEGNGFPSQKIKLPYEGVMRDSVEIRVQDIMDPGSMKKWTRVDDFSMIGPSSECFTVSEYTGEVIFGDGKAGLPPEGKIVLTRAVLSRGFAGTAMEGTILRAEGQPDLMVIKTDIIGKDASTAEEIKDELKQEKESYAMSTAGDYEKQVLKTPGMVINSCKVLESLSSPTKVTIAVRPGDGKELLKLSEEMEHNIYTHLNARRLIGTEIKLQSPEYIKVNTDIQVLPSEQYTDTEKTIKDAVRKFFDEYGSFGDSILFGRLYGIIDGLDCVERILSISFDTDKVSVIKSRSGDLIPPANGLFICNDISVSF